MKRQIPMLLATVIAACLSGPAFAEDDHQIATIAGNVLTAPVTIAYGAFEGAAMGYAVGTYGDPSFFGQARGVLMAGPGAVLGVCERADESLANLDR